MDDSPSENQPPSDETPSSNTPQSHEVRHSQISAVVPEEIATGVYSTGTMILQGQHEFIIDFLLRLGKPHQLVARVILPHSVIPSMIRALESNLKSYEEKFAPPIDKPNQVQPSPEKQFPPIEQQDKGAVAGASHPIVSEQHSADGSPPSHIEELYGEIKISPEAMTGTYANALLIGHSQNEMSFDFITTFYPRSTVSCRVHTAIPTAHRLLDSLIQAHQQFLQRRQPPPQE